MIRANESLGDDGIHSFESLSDNFRNSCRDFIHIRLCLEVFIAGYHHLTGINKIGPDTLGIHHEADDCR